MVSKYLVYGLIDPRTGQIKYIGKSESGLSRPNQHRQKWVLRTQKRSKCISWIKSLAASGQRCEVLVLEETDCRSANIDSECFWIGYFKMLGAELLNMTSGGEGRHGQRHSAAAKALRTKCTPQLGQKCIDLYETGLSLRSIQSLVGLDTRTIRSYMDKADAKRRPNVVAKITDTMVDEVWSLGCSVGWTVAATRLYPDIHMTSFLYHFRNRGLVI